MAFLDHIKELQEMIAKFMKIHNNPHDTSKHEALAQKLQKLGNLMNTITPPTPTQPTNELGLTEEQVTDKLTNFFESFDKITVTVDGQAVDVQVPYFMNYKGKKHPKWDGATETAGKGTPKELREWLQKEIDNGKTKAKDPDALRAYMKKNEMGVDCSGFVSQALNHLADEDGDMDYGSDDEFKPDNTGSGSLKGGAKNFKKIDPSNVKAGDTLFYDNKSGVDHIQIVADTKEENGVKYYTIFESAGSSGPRKKDWKYENGQLYRLDGGKWIKKSSQHFGRWDKLEEKVPSGGDVVTDGGDQDLGGGTSGTMSGSVGDGGDNKESDVIIIQELLNKNGASPSLKVDGDCGAKTIAAINAFQTKMGMAKPDGLISPGKGTWKALNAGSGNSEPVDDNPTDDNPTDNNNDPVDNTGTAIEKSVGDGGDNNESDVIIIQELLNKNGASLKVDGDCGAKTIAAINAFQAKMGMANPDGLISPGKGTWKALIAGGGTSDPVDDNPTDDNPTNDDTNDPVDNTGTAIEKSVGDGGDNNESDVIIIQELLNKNGASLKVDGDCGAKTIAAINAFQARMGMATPDGLISPGKGTWKALVNGLPADSNDTNDGDLSGGYEDDAATDPALSATSKISASVGHKGINKAEDVVLIKTLLNKYGHSFELTGDADAKLTEAIKKFQSDYLGSSSPDGRVDANGKTWRILIGVGRIRGSLVKMAKEYGVDPAVILSIQLIESGSNGYLSDGRPKILFEGHVFWRQLKKVGKDPVALSKGNEDILYPEFDRSKYKGGAEEYNRLARAKKMDKIAALKSASWGEFQIMGFNHKVVGYSDVESFVEAMHQVGGNQLKAVMEFLKNNNLIRYVNTPNKNWTKLAEGYNGKGQKGYDVKLEQAYNRFSKIDF